MTDTYELTQLTEQLEKALIQSYGYVLSSQDLWRILGYKTIYAYRQARHRKTLPIVVFKMQNRRGNFALTTEVAKYLAKAHLSGLTILEEGKLQLND